MFLDNYLVIGEHTEGIYVHRTYSSETEADVAYDILNIEGCSFCIFDRNNNVCIRMNEDAPMFAEAIMDLVIEYYYK